MPKLIRDIITDEDGRRRFEVHPIVRFIHDTGGVGLNTIYALPGITPDQMFEYYQLIGFTVGGIEECPWCTDEMSLLMTELTLAEKPCAHQMKGDRMFCHTCKMRWDTNDPDPPKCKLNWNWSEDD